VLSPPNCSGHSGMALPSAARRSTAWHGYDNLQRALEIALSKRGWGGCSSCLVCRILFDKCYTNPFSIA
jgi:hypothetical protein